MCIALGGVRPLSACALWVVLHMLDRPYTDGGVEGWSCWRGGGAELLHMINSRTCTQQYMRQPLRSSTSEHSSSGNASGSHPSRQVML